MKEAIILAGGFGTRLQSVVNDRPKCMALVANQPFLKYLFDYLEDNCFDHIILSLGYKSEIVLDWINDHSYSFAISYIIEKEPLGTGGAIKYAATKSKSDFFLVLNGDTFFDINIQGLIDFHSKKKSDITLSLKPMVDFDRYGSVLIDTDNRVDRFIEKQFCKEGLINGGVYLINKSVFSNEIFPKQFSFEKEILEAKLNKLRIYGYIEDSYFIDIGIPSDYKKANADFLNLDNDKERKV